VLEAIREDENSQALDRGRLIHCSETKVVYNCCSLPVAGLKVDRVQSLEELLGEDKASQVMAVAVERGIVLLTPKDLEAAGLFTTEKAAERWLERRELERALDYPHHAYRSNISAVGVIAYRIRGRPGRHPSRALVRQDVEARLAIANARAVLPEDIIIVESGEEPMEAEFG